MDIPETLIKRLQAAGERLTIQRRMVIEALCHSDHHLMIHDIQDYIATHYPGQVLSDPTVYRILQWLKDLRIISQTDMGDSGIVYELIGNPPHHHLICRQCGKTLEVDHQLLQDLYQLFLDKTGYQVDSMHVTFFGLCPTCQGKPSVNHPKSVQEE